MNARTHWAVAGCLFAIACTPKGTNETPPRHVEHESVGSVASTTDASPLPQPPQTSVPVGADDLLLSSTDTMRRLERDGYDFGTMLGDSAAHDGAALSRGSHYTDLARVIEGDIADVLKSDKASGVGMAFGHRVFDARYLHDATAHWDLIGVSQRFDRNTFHPGRCGEARFLYRLSYDKTIGGVRIASRLPATAAVSFWNAEQGDPALDRARCPKLWTEWGTATKDRARPVMESPAALAKRFKAVELNVQHVRWPSTTRGDMAGHAEYLLRSLELSTEGHLVEGVLENTPDVGRATSDKAFRDRLRTWLVDPANANAIRRGRAVLPKDFLATRATSATPLGLGRLQNRPFSAIFRASELSHQNPEGLSGVAALRRLDEMSCQGCHASRSIAGFHFLGEETAPAESVNAILVGRSPHLLEDLDRRVSDLGAARNDLAAREIPFPERSRSGPTGRRGERCALDGMTQDPAFQTWQCAAGLTCQRDASSSLDGLGACGYPIAHVGDACEVGSLSPSTDPHRDRVGRMSARACPTGAFCESNHVGFPSGTCAAGCGGEDSEITCGAIPFLVGFNTCLGKGHGVPFEECLRSNARPAGVQACDDSRPCREDYICARTPEGKGACMPPYFLFQLRVDGHP